MQSPSSLREDVPSTSSVAESSEPQAHTAWVAAGEAAETAASAASTALAAVDAAEARVQTLLPKEEAGASSGGAGPSGVVKSERE